MGGFLRNHLKFDKKWFILSDAIFFKWTSFRGGGLRAKEDMDLIFEKKDGPL